MFLVSSCSCLCPIHWSQVLSREWRCSWSSADRRCSNYIWVINQFIAYWGATYIRDLTVYIRIITCYIVWFFFIYELILSIQNLKRIYPKMLPLIDCVFSYVVPSTRVYNYYVSGCIFNSQINLQQNKVLWICVSNTGWNKMTTSISFIHNIRPRWGKK